MATTRRTQEDRSAATRSALVTASTELFATKGYAGVTLDEIVSAAGVTRGALYHHYEDKSALFAAVFETCASAFRDELEQLVERKRTPQSRLFALLDAYLEVCMDPTVRQVALIDGPAVLGFERWRDLERTYFLDLLVAQLERAHAEQPLSSPPEILAPIFFAVALESSLLIGESDRPAVARRKTRGALRQMLEAVVSAS